MTAELFSFTKNGTASLPPLHFSSSANVINESLTCSVDGVQETGQASVYIGISAVAEATLVLGFAASGTLIPPSFDHLSVFAGLCSSYEAWPSLTYNFQNCQWN